MYRCDACDACSPPGQPRLTYTVMRKAILFNWDGTRTEIATEYQLCPRCHRKVSNGTTLAQLFRQQRQQEPPPKPRSPLSTRPLEPTTVNL